MKIILSLGLIFGLLLANELWWRRGNTNHELSRKFIHISVGSFIAFWPFYLSWLDIELLSLAMLIVAILSKVFKLFKAIHSVRRPTWGEVLFAASVGLVALMTHNKWIYAAALLQMALADGLAAIIGMHFGQKHRYLVFGHTKSIIGSLTFLIVSLVVLAGFSHFSHMALGLGWTLIIAGVATALENFAVFGLDNLVVPLSVTLLLINH